MEECSNKIGSVGNILFHIDDHRFESNGTFVVLKEVKRQRGVQQRWSFFQILPSRKSDRLENGISQNLNQDENFIESDDSLRERKEKKKISKYPSTIFLIYNIFLPFFSSILRNEMR